MDLEACIQSLTPGASYSIINGTNNYSDLVWHDTTYAKPTEEEINNKYTELLNNINISILRAERNELLKISDVYVLPDYPHSSEEVRQSWITYRNELRSLPNNNPSPEIDSTGTVINVTFPVAPNGMQRI